MIPLHQAPYPVHWAGLMSSILTPSSSSSLSSLSSSSSEIPKSSLHSSIRRQLSKEGYSNSDIDRTIRGCEWLGLTSNSEILTSPPSLGDVGSVSVIDTFCSLLEKKLMFKESERDLVILHHIFDIQWPKGRQEKRLSTLISYGGDGGKLNKKTGGGGAGGWSAMSRTVGLPAAIATQLILDGAIKSKGVITPVTSELYIPILDSLKKEGIECVEKTVV